MSAEKWSFGGKSPEKGPLKWRRKAESSEETKQDVPPASKTPRYTSEDLEREEAELTKRIGDRLRKYTKDVEDTASAHEKEMREILDGLNKEKGS